MPKITDYNAEPQVLDQPWTLEDLQEEAEAYGGPLAFCEVCGEEVPPYLLVNNGQVEACPLCQ